MLNTAKKVILKNRDGEWLTPYTADTLKKNQITNCILEIPQRIKYTLEDGTLTIKAGSVVIVPYGVEDLTSQYPIGSVFINDNFRVVDTQYEDSKFFVWAELQNDVVSRTSGATEETLQYMFIDITQNITAWQRNTESGTSATASQKYTAYYNTESNLVGMCHDSTTNEYLYLRSFIFLTATNTTSNSWKSVNQVFNGMGYIGSHKWLDKGVKLLCSNGRNEDGTLNNLEIVTEKLSLYTGGTGNVRYNDFYDVGLGCVARISQIKNTFVVNSLSELDDKAGAYAVAYVIPENKFYVHSANEPWEHFIGVQVSYHTNTNSDGTVSEFTPYTPFRAVDYNEFNDLHNDVTTLQQGVGSTKSYITETYVNGTSGYRVWSDGYCEQWGRVTGAGNNGVAVNLLKTFANTNYHVDLTNASNSRNNVEVAVGITSASKIKVFAYQQLILWGAQGYIA